MKVPYVNLGLQYEKDLEKIIEKVGQLLSSGQFILAAEVQNFERSFAKLCGTKFAIGVANGTDALVLAIKAIGVKKDEQIITAPNSFLASASSIVLAGCVPVFADVGADYNIDPKEIEKKITDKTRAIIPVHLTGNPARMDEINKLAAKYNLKVIEDAAQAVGAKYKGMTVGGLGDLACFSLHPLKNLSAAGDGGMITTNNEDYYNFLLNARNHGLKSRDECGFFSLNSRLDNLQAAILNVKINNLESWNRRRREIAQKYINALADLVELPIVDEEDEAVYHAFVIQTEDRKRLMDYLYNCGIDTKIHYPIPIHLQEASLNYFSEKQYFENTEIQMTKIMSLPIYPELSDEQIEYVISCIKEFYN